MSNGLSPNEGNENEKTQGECMVREYGPVYVYICVHIYIDSCSPFIAFRFLKPQLVSRVRNVGLKMPSILMV